MPVVVHTTVGIVGAGPAGLMVGHLLHQAGIDSVAVDHRSREEIEQTVRAGILERGSVRLLVDSGVGDRVLREGDAHAGIELAFGGARHRIDFTALVDSAVWLYPQTEVFVDLADARARAGGQVHFGVSATRVDGLTTEPVIAFQDAVGLPHEIHCRYLVGADGSHSLCRRQIPENARRQYFREYPFAWFGIIAQAPRSAPELIYNQSERGFALISQRTATVQRMYFQCDPDTDVAAWSDDRIWDEIQARLAPNGHQVVEGPILDKTVLGFRSFVNEPMQYGRMLLAGDAAHTVPPTGAKGLNLALADAAILAEVLEKAIRTDDPDVSAEYSPRALRRVWRATHFSYWMTTMLHRLPGMSDFDVRRQTAELESLTASPAGRTFLAEGYTGLTGQVN